MATYCTQSDIENVFGAVNVRKWSNLDNTDSINAAANTTRITAAIAWASQYIDDRLRGRFSIPLSGTSLTYRVMDWAAKLAGVWLYEGRGLSGATETDQNTNAVRLHKGIVNAEIDRVLAGMDTLDLASGTTNVAPALI